jgi:hypothetical protein
LLGGTAVQLVAPFVEMARLFTLFAVSPSPTRTT